MGAELAILRLYMGHVTGPIGPLPIYAFAVRHPGGVVLVDTGLTTNVDPELIAKYKMEARTMDAALADHDLTIADVTHIAVTHLDHDHSANNNLFRHVPAVVQRPELADARSSHDAEYRKVWDRDDGDFCILVGDGEVVPGMTALSTPGHTPGHQSFLVERGNTTDLIIGDAAYTQEIYHNAETYDESHPVWSIQVRTNRETWLGSIERLRALDVDRIYFSHDDKVGKQAAR